MSLNEALINQNELFEEFVSANDDFHYSLGSYYWGPSNLSSFHNHDFDKRDLTNIIFNACAVNAKRLLKTTIDMYLNNLKNNLVNQSFVIDTPFGEKNISINESVYSNSLLSKLYEFDVILNNNFSASDWHLFLSRDYKTINEHPLTLITNPSDFSFSSVNSLVEALHSLGVMLSPGDVKRSGLIEYNFSGLKNFKENFYNDFIKLFPTIVNNYNYYSSRISLSLISSLTDINFRTLNNKILVHEKKISKNESIIHFDCHMPLRRHYSRFQGKADIIDGQVSFYEATIKYIDHPDQLKAHEFLKELSSLMNLEYLFDKNNSFTYSTVKTKNPDYIKPLVHTITMITDLQQFFDSDNIEDVINRISIKELAYDWFIKILTGAYQSVNSFTGLTNEAIRTSEKYLGGYNLGKSLNFI